ncbi:MAG: CoA transferase [Chloroflexi bacterium]|nr:CoA transferase [Chloroflexota bacterium]
MPDYSRTDTLLGPYRVLDLTSELGLMCGKMLGDLGADVIKLERPGGDPARNRGPFYKDQVHPEKSLFWFAHNVNKRGLTLNIRCADGQELLKRLVTTADFLIESYAPGFLESLGLDYEDLSQINPRLVMVSITPFGRTGPKARHKMSELTMWASGGEMYLTGDPDRAPLWISLPQAGLQGSLEALAGAMVAHWHRENTGEGQHVDVSIQEAVIWQLMGTPIGLWACHGENQQRRGTMQVQPKATYPGAGQCKDGFFTGGILGGGASLHTVRTQQGLVSWMDAEGRATPELKGYDWRRFDGRSVTQEEADRLAKPILDFYKTKTVRQIHEEGVVQRRMTTAAFYTAKDVLADPQLQARDYWVKLEHPELGESLTYPGAYAKMSETPLKFRRRAPLIGEHNDELYRGELGLSASELALLKGRRVI